MGKKKKRAHFIFHWKMNVGLNSSNNRLENSYEYFKLLFTNEFETNRYLT